MKKILVLLVILTNNIYGQTPKIIGTLDIDLSGGKVTCDFTITNIPKFDDLALCINRGWNIYDLKVNGRSIDFNVDWGFPGRSLFLSDGIGIVPNIDTITQETQISIKYTGAFPTYSAGEEIASGDGMNVIAIKDNILRASHQSLWYPVLVDRTTNFTLTKYTYNITVKCKECESIYIGGSNPVKSKNASLQSSEPNDLMLYAGKYKFSRFGNTYFLNSSLPRNEQEIINISLDSVRHFYSGIIGSDSEPPLVLAQIFSIGYKSQYEKWAFVVYPCIVADLSEIPKQINESTRQFSDINAYRIYSHELAHQYFGLKLKSNNEYWGFYSESFAEYMCLKAIEQSFGKEKYNEFLRQRYLNEKAISNKYIHLDDVKSDIDNNHKYYYYPMLLLGLEQTVGQAKMFRFLNFIVTQTTSTNLDYQTFKQSALGSGITESEWREFELLYVKSDNCIKEILNKL